jgi:hypothetical protein
MSYVHANVHPMLQYQIARPYPYPVPCQLPQDRSQDRCPKWKQEIEGRPASWWFAEARSLLPQCAGVRRSASTRMHANFGEKSLFRRVCLVDTPCSSHTHCTLRWSLTLLLVLPALLALPHTHHLHPSVLSSHLQQRLSSCALPKPWAGITHRPLYS